MKQLFGGILLAIGILIAGASGLCSLFFVVQATSQPDGSGVIPVILSVGTLPFLFGVVLILIGLGLLRSDRNSGNN